MPDLMAQCEKKTLFKIDGENIWKWKIVDVSDLQTGERPDIRCMHCHGQVRVHKQQVNHGPQDHVEHRARQDSENCIGGHYFKGTHRESSNPVK